MVRQRIFVTGIGIINPAGIGKEEFWRNITTGCSAIRSITRFDTTNHQIKVAGEIANFQPEDFISRRLIAKTDRFTHYALAAAELALIDANLDLKQEDPYRIGVWFGNNGGGWDTYEQALYQFYQEGPSMVNPLHANAWFSTAAQAYVSIYHNIRGCSKSFVCDRASGACGLYFGIKSIQQGDNDVVLAGGTEAPINELSFIFYHQTGELSPVTNPEKAYLPFDRDRTGLVLGEGSTILVLESEQHAIRRDAKIYGEIVSSSMTTELNPSSGLAFEQAMHQVLRDAGIICNIYLQRVPICRYLGGHPSRLNPK